MSKKNSKPTTNETIETTTNETIETTTNETIETTTNKRGRPVAPWKGMLFETRDAALAFARSQGSEKEYILNIREVEVSPTGKRGRIPTGMSKLTRFKLVIPYADRA